MQGPLFQARGGCPFLASRPDLANSVPPHPLPNTESMMSCPASSSPSSSYSASELSIDNVPEPSVTPETISLFNVMDDLLECVVVSDANGIILRANTAAQKLFGYTAQELVGNNVAMLCEPEIARIHHTFLDRYLDTRRPVVIGTAGRDVRGQHKNGTLLPLRLSVAETRQSGSTLFVAQLHDLRPIKQREEELRVLSQLNKTVAERASADIHERIMHSVAHELRNPLQTIMGSLYMLQSSLSSISPSDKESLEDIQEAIRKCCSVLDNAVLVCNYQKTKLTQNSSFELANVSDVLVDVRKQLDFFTPVHIRLEIDKSVPPQAFFNVTHTRQILKYAIANAGKRRLMGDVVVRACAVPNTAVRKADLSTSDTRSQDMLRFEIEYCCELASKSAFADSAAWLLPVSHREQATVLSDTPISPPSVSLSKSASRVGTRSSPTFPFPYESDHHAVDSTPSPIATPISNPSNETTTSRQSSPASECSDPFSGAATSSAPPFMALSSQATSSNMPAISTSLAGLHQSPSFATYHIHQQSTTSVGALSSASSVLSHEATTHCTHGAMDSFSAPNHLEMQLITQRMLEVTTQLVTAMGGSCAMRVLGCKDIVESSKTAHFTSKLYWFTVPFQYSAPQDSSPMACIAEAVNRLLTIGEKQPETIQRPFRLSNFNADGTTSSVSLSASQTAGIEDIKLNKRVLFVDDEPTIGKMSSRFLQKLGCTCTVLSDGDQVMDALRKQTYDIVLLDIVMPRLNGEDACALIRSTYPNLPVIAATANTSAQDQTRYRQVGFNGCLAKPYSIQDMRVTIMKWTSGPSPT